MIAGQLSKTQMSVMPALGLTAPGLTFGAALSKSTRERSRASFPVTTRRMGRSFSVMWFYSIKLQVRLLHDRCVSVVLSPEELGVLLGRVTRRLLAQGEEAFPDFGNLEDLADFPRKPSGNFARRSRGRHEADPAGHLVSGEVVGDGRQLRHGRGALRARHAKRSQATRFHEADDTGHGLLGVGDLAAHEVRDR